MAKRKPGETDIKIRDIMNDPRTPYAREKSILHKVKNWLEEQKKAKTKETK